MEFNNKRIIINRIKEPIEHVEYLVRALSDWEFCFD